LQLLLEPRLAREKSCDLRSSRSFELAVHFVELAQHALATDQAGANRFARRRVVVELRLLLQVTEAQVTAHDARARVDRLEPGQDAQQRRLAAAVRAHQADSFLITEDEIDTPQQDALVEALDDPIERKQRHARGW
jgi:hypothetical protein